MLVEDELVVAPPDPPIELVVPPDPPDPPVLVPPVDVVPPAPPDGVLVEVVAPAPEDPLLPPSHPPRAWADRINGSERKESVARAMRDGPAWRDALSTCARSA